MNHNWISTVSCSTGVVTSWAESHIIILANWNKAALIHSPMQRKSEGQRSSPPQWPLWLLDFTCGQFSLVVDPQVKQETKPLLFMKDFIRRMFFPLRWHACKFQFFSDWNMQRLEWIAEQEVSCFLHVSVSACVQKMWQGQTFKMQSSIFESQCQLPIGLTSAWELAS